MRALILALVALCGCSAHRPVWIGSPGVANPDAYYMHDGFVTSVEIGLRRDGVVIWRKKPAAGTEESK